MEYSKEQCCCFTGHRRVPEEQIIEINAGWRTLWRT